MDSRTSLLIAADLADSLLVWLIALHLSFIPAPTPFHGTHGPHALAGYERLSITNVALMLPWPSDKKVFFGEDHPKLAHFLPVHVSLVHIRHEELKLIDMCGHLMKLYGSTLNGMCTQERRGNQSWVIQLVYRLHNGRLHWLHRFKQMSIM